MCSEEWALSNEQANIPISDAETKRSPCIALIHL